MRLSFEDGFYGFAVGCNSLQIWEPQLFFILKMKFGEISETVIREFSRERITEEPVC